MWFCIPGERFNASVSEVTSHSASVWCLTREIATDCRSASHWCSKTQKPSGWKDRRIFFLVCDDGFYISAFFSGRLPCRLIESDFTKVLSVQTRQFSILQPSVLERRQLARCLNAHIHRGMGEWWDVVLEASLKLQLLKLSQMNFLGDDTHFE